MKLTAKSHGKIVAVLTTYAVGVSVIYMYNRSVMFHETMYTLGVLVVGYFSRQSLLRHPGHEPAMKKLLVLSIVGYVGATCIWVVDNTYCEQLRTLREAFGPYIAPMLQLHAVWHLGTGFGTYCFTCFNAYSKALEMEPPRIPRVRYILGVLPWIDVKEPGKTG
jgi:dihydroceramidase